MTAPSPRSSLPQGFSVYQPALGAQLQFFPALGTQQLDDLINAHVPGPASIKDKRASISLDFLEYARATGQTFKFYAAAASVAASPRTGSPPSLDSAASSSFNVSPVTSSWDWSATASVSSRSSTHRRRPAKANSSSATSPPSRHQTTDFSSLPGMKILTKDGLDVTSSASRGSKTKEQRDHAHLMRIIKACDACRRKKIRCDPSHKKRGGVSAHSQSAAATASKPSRKTKSPPQEESIPHQSQPPPPPLPSEMAVDALDAFLTPSFDLDFSFSHLESLDPLPDYAWEDFMQLPATDTAADYDFHLDPENYFASHSSGSSSSASPFKASTPQSQQEPGAPPGLDDVSSLQGAQAASPQYPFLDQPGSAGDYTDFNLFSPGSSFSEDDRMLSVGSSSEPMSSEYSLPGFDSWHIDAALPDTACDRVAGVDCSDASSLGDSTHRHLLPPGVSSSPALSLSDQQVVICCAPDTVVLTPGGYHSRMLYDAPTSLTVSGSATAAANPSESSVESVPRGSAEGQADVAIATLHTELQATVSAQDCIAATSSSAPGHDRLSEDAAYGDALLAHLAASDGGDARAPRDEAVDFNDLESLDADAVRVTHIRTHLGRHVSPVAQRAASEPSGLSDSPADAAIVAPWLPAPPGVDRPSPADGVFNHGADLAPDDDHLIRWQRCRQRTESPDTTSLARPEGVVPGGHTSLPAPFTHQTSARSLAPHMQSVAVADEPLRAAPADEQTMTAQDAHSTAQQLPTLSERSVVATTAEGVAAALILLTASMMPALQWAHVVVVVMVLSFKLASVSTTSTYGKLPPLTVEGKLSRALSGARQSDLMRMARGLAGMRCRASKSFFPETSWRAASTVALLRG